MDRLYEEGQAHARNGHARRVAAKFHHLEEFKGSGSELQQRKYPGPRVEEDANVKTEGVCLTDICRWLAQAAANGLDTEEIESVQVLRRRTKPLPLNKQKKKVYK
jgi:hypothetical protein